MVKVKGIVQVIVWYKLSSVAFIPFLDRSQNIDSLHDTYPE